MCDCTYFVLAQLIHQLLELVIAWQYRCWSLVERLLPYQFSQPELRLTLHFNCIMSNTNSRYQIVL